MKKISSLIDPQGQVYYPTVTEDLSKTLLKEAQKITRHNESLRRNDLIRQQNNKNYRISNSKIDKQVHAIRIIIEKAEEALSPTSPIEYGDSFSIDYYNFNFEDRSDARVLFENFLNKLKNAHCFINWSKNPYRSEAVYIFKKIDIQKLRMYASSLNIGSKANILKFSRSTGYVIFFDKDGIKYESKFKTNTDYYKLLNYLVKQPHIKFPFDELADQLNKPKSMDQGSGDEKRVRDTVAYIKKKLKYRGNDLFISDYGFGLNCDVFLIG